MCDSSNIFASIRIEIITNLRLSNIIYSEWDYTYITLVTEVQEERCQSVWIKHCHSYICNKAHWHYLFEAFKHHIFRIQIPQMMNLLEKPKSVSSRLTPLTLCLKQTSASLVAPSKNRTIVLVSKRPSILCGIYLYLFFSNATR